MATNPNLVAIVPLENAQAHPPTRRITKWDRPRKYQTRWGPADDKPYLPPAFVDVPPGLSGVKIDRFLREQRLDELNRKLVAGELEFGDPDIRSPSPPPIYDKSGNRTNTRDIRVKTAMQMEYNRLIEYMSSHVEGYVPPADFKPIKKIRRIVIPQDKYPEYNFMGLIIGPRGCNHKRLETESGSQISIRGRGTQKEGKKTDHQTDEEAAMPQHVHIAADTEEKLEKAVGLIEPLLDPFHPMHEEFKKKGLEQLAVVTGTSGALGAADQRCAVCGSLAHLGWECPEVKLAGMKRPDIKCAYCDALGHVTMDCKVAREAGVSAQELLAKHRAVTAGSAAPSPEDMWKMDMEYQKLMTEMNTSGEAKGVGPTPVPPPGGALLGAAPVFHNALRRGNIPNGSLMSLGHPSLGPSIGGLGVPPPPGFEIPPPPPGGINAAPFGAGTSLEVGYSRPMQPTGLDGMLWQQMVPQPAQGMPLPSALSAVQLNPPATPPAPLPVSLEDIGSTVGIEDPQDPQSAMMQFFQSLATSTPAASFSVDGVSEHPLPNERPECPSEPEMSFLDFANMPMPPAPEPPAPRD